MTRIRLTKTGQGRNPVATFIQGDSRTSVISMVIDRYESGVDLSNLIWTVNVVNSAWDKDVVLLTNTNILPQTIELSWLVYGIATSTAGITTFEVRGLQDGTNILVWQSAKYYLMISDYLEADAGDDPTTLSILEQLLAQVGEVTNNLATLQSEVYDIRTDVNGTVYPSAGDAVRANIAIVG